MRETTSDAGAARAPGEAPGSPMLDEASGILRRELGVEGFRFAHRMTNDAFRSEQLAEDPDRAAVLSSRVPGFDRRRIATCLGVTPSRAHEGITRATFELVGKVCDVL